MLRKRQLSREECETMLLCEWNREERVRADELGRITELGNVNERGSVN
jgi:hypothetical protein